MAMTVEMERRISTNKWLRSEELLLCMNLLRRQFPYLGGLIDPGFLIGPRIPEQATQCINLYIVHCGGNHWICAKLECIKPVFAIYDSMAKMKIQADVRQGLCKVAPTGVRFVNVAVQQQVGPYDFGLYAAAFIVSLAFGENPLGRTYIQHRMREHLLSCLKQGEIHIFP